MNIIVLEFWILDEVTVGNLLKMWKVVKLLSLVLIWNIVNVQSKSIDTKDVMEKLGNFEAIKAVGVVKFLDSLKEFQNIPDPELAKDLAALKVLVAVKGFEKLEDFEVLKMLAVLAKLKAFKALKVVKVLKLKKKPIFFPEEEQDEEYEDNPIFTLPIPHFELPEDPVYLPEHHLNLPEHHFNIPSHPIPSHPIPRSK